MNTQLPSVGSTLTLPVRFSVTWGKYPAHQKRWAKVMVAGLVVELQEWTTEGKAKVVKTLRALLEGQGAQAEEWLGRLLAEIEVVKL